MTKRKCLEALPVDDGRTGRSTFIVHDSINLDDDDDDVVHFYSARFH